MIKYLNNKLQWIATFIITLSFWILFGSTIINLYASLVYSLDIEKTFINSTIYKYIGVNLPFFCIILGLYFTTKYINKTKIKLLINDSLIINYKLFFYTLIESLGILLVITLIGNYLNIYDLTINSSSFSSRLIFILLALIFTPIQVLAEELLFRSLLIKIIINKYQSLKNKKSNLLFSIIISLLIGLIFIIPHLLNPEVRSNFTSSIIYYFTFGALATLSILITNGLEIALATHLANNLLIALFCNYKNSALPSISLFIKTNELSFSKYFDIIILIILFIIIGIFNKKRIREYFKIT